MKQYLILLLCLTSLSFAGQKKEIPGGVAAFPLASNDLTLSRPAQPSQYFDKIGTKAGLMGFESGMFEMWVWPWKPLRNFELSFLLGTSTQPLQGRDLVRSISVTPEATTITYTYESFTVREIIFVPREMPGAILLLDVHNNVPITIVSSFLPVMQPMWPGGIGGQFSYFDDDNHGYVISEGRWRAAFLCGSPAAQPMAAPPAHMFADNPLQFKIDINPGDADGKYIPIVIAGGMMKTDTVKSLFNAMAREPKKYYDENVQYYKNLRNSTVRLVTPNHDLNLALEWGKFALDNLMVTNPNLGTGLVAGYGVSGGGGRPGFAWFFGGDAFINALTFDAYGAYGTVRDALAFTQKWQRQDNYPVRKKKPDDVNQDIGKMAHELSQSDGLVDWWNDYHYGYNHADTTPWYLVALGDYVRSSGDTTFLRQSWKSAQAAYAWCLSKDSDGDGLMDLKGAGLGALEFGKLVNIYADMYTCGVWVQGIKEMADMAALMNDAQLEKAARAQLAKAQPALEKKFWMDREGFYSYGATEKGEQVKERTPWVGTAIMFGLLDSVRTRKTMTGLNGAEICSDWGTRSLSPKSTLFEPTNYNYGAAWPFISSFFGTAQFLNHDNLAGYSTIESVVRHVFDNGLGVVPEVFSGDINQKLAEGYHHQGFSTTGYMLPTFRGLIGLDVNSLKRSVTLRPHIPANWKSVEINGIRADSTLVNAIIEQSDSIYQVRFRINKNDGVDLRWNPDLPPGTKVTAVTLNGKAVESNLSGILFAGKVHDGDSLAIHHSVVAAILPPVLDTEPGATNHSLKVVSYSADPESPGIIHFVAEGLAGRSYSVDIQHPELMQKVSGASIKDSHLVIDFDGKATGFVRKEITFRLQ